MNKYETVFLMNKDITEERRNEIVTKIKDTISNDGKVIEEKELGIKKLAYEVKKQKEAYYYSIIFESKAESINEIERIQRIIEEILKFITVKVS